MREYDTMHEDACWSVIASFDWEEAGDDDAVLEPAVNKLVAWSEEDIFAFHDFLAEPSPPVLGARVNEEFVID